MDPIIFLTGPSPRGDRDYCHQGCAEPPFLTLVVGEYGVGKTELISQVVQCLDDRDAGGDRPIPLPVRLVSCRRSTHAEILRRSALGREETLELLFQHLRPPGEPAWDDAVLSERLYPAIQEGQVLLLLDGADELIFDAVSHRNFFASLVSMLEGDEASGTRARAVVSMRLEYYSSYDDPAGQRPRLAGTLRPGRSGRPVLNLHFLLLTLFEEQSIRLYLANHLRCPDGQSPWHAAEQLMERLRVIPEVLETLQRPLLLTIFTELVNERKLGNLEDYRVASNLIRDYVEMSLEDRQIQLQHEQVGTLKWKKDAFPRKCLEVYRRGDDVLKIADLEAILAVEGQEDPTRLLESIHKCPIFQRAGQGELRFAHRAFLEYYTVRGVVEELEDRQQTMRSAHESAFDELVLNVDMRKFLRAAIEERAKRDDGQGWFDETRRSYGLDDRGQWRLDPRRFETLREDLEKHRQVLLDVMTDLDLARRPEARESVDWFLAHVPEGLHPGYVRFNLEAVAVYLRERRWDADSAALSGRFERLLGEEYGASLRRLRELPREGWERRELELLLERILAIGVSRRQEWTAGVDRREVMDAIENENTRKRVGVILHELRSG